MIKIGKMIADRYEIQGLVGSGGMSDVYKARDLKLNRLVAIKILKAEYSEDASFVSKFKAEAQSAAGLSHPNVVNVYDVGEENGIHFIVMELVEGITLKHYITRKGKLTFKETISIAIQVAQGIEAAHANHIIHRDIKPQNIIISRAGKVKVADFGIARAASTNTINSNAMGSVHYISPEQARGGYIDERSDIYSLGITLFEMITGQLPFKGESTVTVALQHIQDELPSLDDYVEGIPISLKKIILKCTQKKPERRYAKVSSLISDLKHALLEPEDDFVVIAPLVDEKAPTVLITDAELKDIKMGTNKVKLDEFADEDDELDEDDENELDDEFDDDSDIDKINPKIEKIITIGSIVVAIIIVLIVIMIFIKLFGGGGSTRPMESTTNPNNQETLDSKHVYMPNLLGMNENDVADFLNKEYSLGVSFLYEYNAEYKRGEVCRQSVEPDTVVSKNTTITVTISQGGKEIIIPDFTGYTLDQLKDWGKENEVSIHVTEWVVDQKIPMNGVVSWAPKAPVKLVSGGSLDVVVSRGPDQNIEITIPDLSNKTLEEATAELEELGLVVGTVEEEYHETVEAGKICNQYPKSGDVLPVGSSVDLVVSKGSNQKAVPNVLGKTEEEATQMLTAEGFVVLVELVNDPEIPVGYVVSQSLSEGTMATLGSEITISVSEGPEASTTQYSYTIHFDRIDSSIFELPETAANGDVQIKLVIVFENGPKEDVTTEAWTPEWVKESFTKSDTADSVPVSAYLELTVTVAEGDVVTKQVLGTITFEEVISE